MQMLLLCLDFKFLIDRIPRGSASEELSFQDVVFSLLVDFSLKKIEKLNNSSMDKTHVFVIF